MAHRVAIIGGGAAGFFAAISCAEANPDARVTVFEKSRHLLSKVRVSGGGRCNVTHACFDARELTKRYPRGARELLGPFHVWQPQDTVEWFESRGVALKTEPDGRMFPTTDSSETIIDCLLGEAHRLGIEVRIQSEIFSVSADPARGFVLSLADGARFEADKLVVASGGGERSGGLKIARELGHAITELAPSLFTFHIADPRIEGLQGLSAPNVRVSFPQAKLEQSGPMLVTHWGLSGPAILKLSAWGAREFARLDYRFELRVDWLGDATRADVLAKLAEQKRDAGRKTARANCPFELPRRIWERLTDAAGILADVPWAQLGKAQMEKLADELVDGRYAVTGKSMNKEEFVTCGGVKLSEVDFKRMESRLVPGLHFAGEVLDIDGVTGGFNFQAAWTTGRVAGVSAAEAII